jgi:hypothetical protein
MFIPDPHRFEFFQSRIPDPHQKNLSILTPKKLFPSSRKYDPGLFIPDPDPDFLPIPDPDFLPIPDPGVKKAPDPGSATQILVPVNGKSGYTTGYASKADCLTWRCVQGCLR